MLFFIYSLPVPASLPLHISFAVSVAHHLIRSSWHPSSASHSIYRVLSIFLLPFLISSLLTFQLQIKVQESSFSSKFLQCYLQLCLSKPTLIFYHYKCLCHLSLRSKLYILAISRNIVQPYQAVSTFLGAWIFLQCSPQIN